MGRYVKGLSKGRIWRLDNMILIIAGTQTKQFERLFKVVDNAIQKGIINDDVVAQLGYTKFKSSNMKTFDFKLSIFIILQLQSSPQELLICPSEYLLKYHRVFE